MEWSPTADETDQMKGRVYMKVRNMVSKKTGKGIPNQFIISDIANNTVLFQSYDSIIIKLQNGKVYLDQKYWDYSRTTGKYRNQFLRETKKQTEWKIQVGEYILCDLNC